MTVVEKKPLMKIQNLSLNYKNSSAFSNINLNILPQEVLALIGPSGSGKSSFLNCLNQLFLSVPCCTVEGSIEFEGRVILGGETTSAKLNLQHLRRNIGMVFQRPHPFPNSIYKNMSIPLKEVGIKSKDSIDETIHRTFSDVGLWDELKDRLQSSALELSGGQQQRLCIARAIALKPKLLLMDEPTSSLDPIAAQTIESLITELKKKYAVVMVTHNLAQARRISDKLALIYPINGIGHLIEYGETAHLFKSPQEDLTKEYFSREL